MKEITVTGSKNLTEDLVIYIAAGLNDRTKETAKAESEMIADAFDEASPFYTYGYLKDELNKRVAKTIANIDIMLTLGKVAVAAGIMTEEQLVELLTW